MTYEPLPVHTGEQIEAMSERQYQSYETRCRRAAQRQGYQMVKSRSRDPRARSYRRFWMIWVDSGGIVAGGDHGVTLSAVGKFLTMDAKDSIDNHDDPYYWEVGDGELPTREEILARMADGPALRAMQED